VFNQLIARVERPPFAVRYVVHERVREDARAVYNWRRWCRWHVCRLTVKLRGRVEAHDQSRGCTLVLPHPRRHYRASRTLQRLLGVGTTARVILACEGAVWLKSLLPPSSAGAPA
jgi:hypothetical protein